MTLKKRGRKVDDALMLLKNCEILIKSLSSPFSFSSIVNLEGWTPDSFLPSRILPAPSSLILKHCFRFLPSHQPQTRESSPYGFTVQPAFSSPWTLVRGGQWALGMPLESLKRTCSCRFLVLSLQYSEPPSSLSLRPKVLFCDTNGPPVQVWYHQVSGQVYLPGRSWDGCDIFLLFFPVFVLFEI